MRTMFLTTLLAFGVASAAAGQPVGRFEVAPVVRADHVFLEGNAGGSTAVAGVAATVMLTTSVGIEGEVTGAAGDIEHQYEGWFVSAAGPGASREEIERLAPTARRTLGYAPGIGGAVAVVFRGDASPRVRLGGRVGFAARGYDETSTFTLLTIPDGIDPEFLARNFQPESHSRTRGGLLLGADGVIAITRHISVAPEVRFVYGGPARVGNKYREFGVGGRLVWRF